MVKFNLACFCLSSASSSDQPEVKLSPSVLDQRSKLSHSSGSNDDDDLLLRWDHQHRVGNWFLLTHSSSSVGQLTRLRLRLRRRQQGTHLLSDSMPGDAGAGDRDTEAEAEACFLCRETRHRDWDTRRGSDTPGFSIIKIMDSCVSKQNLWPVRDKQNQQKQTGSCQTHGGLLYSVSNHPFTTAHCIWIHVRFQ